MIARPATRVLVHVGDAKVRAEFLPCKVHRGLAALNHCCTFAKIRILFARLLEEFPRRIAKEGGRKRLGDHLGRTLRTSENAFEFRLDFSCHLAVRRNVAQNPGAFQLRLQNVLLISQPGSIVRPGLLFDLLKQ